MRGPAKGAIRNDRGIDVHALLNNCSESKAVVGFKSAEAMASAELLTMAVDILAPEAESSLLSNGVLVVPDILARDRVSQAQCYRKFYA